MKRSWKHAMWALALVLVVGCADRDVTTTEPQSPSPEVLQLSNARARVDDMQRDSHSGVTELSLTVDDGGMIPYERYVTLAPNTGGDLPIGLAASLRTGDGEILAEASFAWDLEGERSHIIERTATDEIVMSRTRSSDEITETYAINGVEYAIHYPVLPAATLKRAFGHYRDPARRPRPVGEGVDELMTAIETFDGFYTPHRSNTLHNNPDGELLMALITSERLNTLVKERFGDDIVTAPGHWWNIACRVAGVCAYFKCMYGGPVNWVCDICSIVSLSCALTFFAF